jgi:hypothetical protein
MKFYISIIGLACLMCLGCSNREYPNPDRIKHDLIGEETEQWNFEYLSEFIELEIVKWNESDDILEGQLKMELLDTGDNTTNVMEAIIVYKWRDYKWTYNKVGQLSLEVKSDE